MVENLHPNFNFDIHKLLAHVLDQVLSADNLCKQFGPRSGPTNVGPDLDPNCLTLRWYS